MQSSLTHHTTELSILCQTTDLISQSLQVLLECLPPNSAPPVTAEPAPTASAPISAAPVTLWLQIPHPALLDAYNENETAFSDTLHSETEEPQSPLSDIQTLTPEPLPSSLTPLKYVMASAPSTNSLHLDVEDLDLLDPPPLAFPHKEALYEDNWSNSGALEEERRGEFGGICKPELLDKAVEVGDQIYATTIHLLPSITEIWASQTMSQWLAQAFTANAMPQEFWDVVPPYLHVFKDVFSKASFNLLLECKRWDHAIELLPDSAPSSCKVYLLMPQEQDKLNTFLQENLDSGRIYPSKSLMASPVLNAITVKNCYSLPLISELINNLWGVQYFTKLDVWWDYNNVHIQEGDEWKAAFWTNQGMFEPLVMFFELTNSSTTFQTMMNDIFWDLIAEGIVCVYLENILIYTKMLEEHRQITCLVLECLYQHQLYLKLEKCKFEQTQIEYLGLIILHGTVEMDPVKVAGMAEWPEPKNKKEVQAFLGFANFYWRFIQNFSYHACPLFDLMGKDVPWSWGPLEQMVFDTLKCAVTSGPVLLFLNNNSPFQVEADSSNFATGAVLSQQSSEDGKWHLVAFYSKSLNAVEQNYKIHDKEILAIIWLFEEWWHFLEGMQHKFEVWTDHKNLEYFQTAKKLNC
ncbi:hypothetical protein E4T56_gene19654 [Termitomyces sp. T112]|nr:hypothetical protein E4T56_gene19654 [Termitomyces sp. T112]